MTKAPDIVEAFELFNGMIYRHILVRVGWKKQVAEDLTQDVFLKAWKYRQNFDQNKSSLKTWLYVITNNTIRDYFRTRKNPPEQLPEYLASSFDLHRSQSDRQLYAFVLDKFGLLSESDQEILALRYIEDLPVKQISKITGKSYTATKVALHRAIKRLQEVCNENN